MSVNPSNGNHKNVTTNGKDDNKNMIATNNQHVSSTITSTHLLAENFIPSHLKAINMAKVSTIIPTKPLQTMEEEIRRVFNETVGDSIVNQLEVNDPMTSLNGNRIVTANISQNNKHNLSDCFNCRCIGKQQCTDYPKAVKTTRELAFASDQAQKRLISTNSSMGKNIVLDVINEMGATHHYLAVFRELLQVEHAEKMRLYEQAYNQYKTELSIPYALSTDKGKTNQGEALLKVMGIADGRPSLRPGDKALIRPIGLVTIVTPITTPPNNNSYPYNSYNPNPHSLPQRIQQHPHQPIYRHLTPQMVEVDAQVISVTRSKVKDQVLVSWVLDQFLDTQLKRHKCNVRFVPNSVTHERCLTALGWIRSIDPTVARDLLYPSQPPQLPPPPATDENIGDESEYQSLNNNQARFVQMVTTRTAYPTKERVRPPMILTGPAGTGKTKALLAAILQVLHQGGQHTNSDKDYSWPTPRILVCTPSHTASDVITQRLAKLLLVQHLDDNNINTNEDQHKLMRKMLFRLYDSTQLVETVPVQVLSYTRQGDGGQFVLPSTHELLQFSVIVCTCQDAHLLFLAGFTNSSLRKRRNCVRLDTEQRLRSAGLELRGIIEGANSPHFTHLFIDEAAQATEPETLIPMSVVVDDHDDATKTEIALCGDPRQLGPSIYSPNASEGLQRSLLERLLRLPVVGGREHLMGAPSVDSCITLAEMIEYSFQKVDYQHHLSVFLNISYRGHPSFLLMPSSLFYFNKLKSAATRRQLIGQSSNIEDSIWLRAARQVESLSEKAFPESITSQSNDWPMVFQGIIGKCTSIAIESFFGSNCWCNHAEAETVVHIVEQIVEVGVSTASIGVMAAFRAQVVLIRNMLRKINLDSVNVGMVEDYQSMERDVIILSLTRANRELVKADVGSGEGLLCQPKRMNVALTRAENLLVVVGNPDTMEKDIAWAKWLEFCKVNGLWYGESGEMAVSG